MIDKFEDHNEFDKETHCESLMPRLYDSAREAMKYMFNWHRTVEVVAEQMREEQERGTNIQTS